MSRPFREHSKSTLLRATEILYDKNRALVASERRRWLPRVVAAGVGGLALGLTAGYILTRMVF